MWQIPDDEFKQRVVKLQEEVNRQGLDAVIVHANESDPTNVRYLSDYWPTFETGGVVIPKEGEAILIIGPESETYARDFSKIRKIRKILEYRESAEPDYPGISLSNFEQVFDEASKGKGIKKLGIIGYSIMSVPIYEAIRKALPEAEIVRVDNILRNMRAIKSENEIALLKEAFRISEIALKEVLDEIKPGMTELEAVGIAQKSIYVNGAEYEGLPLYIFSGKRTTNAISRPTHKRFKKGELIQLGIGAKVGGYSSSVQRPLCLGKMPGDVKDLVQAGLDAHKKTLALIKAGVNAGELVRKYYDFVKSLGYEKNILYGPCHGLGMMEVEPPWIELTSDYVLQENMTFQVDNFLLREEYGLRWEDGVRVTKSGVEEFSNIEQRIIEID